MQMEGESAQRFAARLLERVRAEAPALDVALRWVEAEGAFRAETASARMGLIRFADGKCDVRPEAEAWTRISILHVLCEAAVVSMGGQARLVVFSCEKSGRPGTRG